jgi:tRNA 2-thiouridine synthesizing protein A
MPVKPASVASTMATGSAGTACDAQWDAGDMGCGELVLGLRTRLKALRSGQVLRLIAHDPGAIEDLPAWCRLTGHHLIHAEHPMYCIQRKED